ncbi:DUF885 domain-containing protein [Alteromonas aestuariivivens]|uniref:DUF885 domain-containing protein n=1 Tax=Alteromonas aestuariivivens TaxID=1938339 RepID=A0A3D8M8Q3_9ALTE|nr:DUF885 domain-containing protein [Alteromonas aestuariivivens]RDV25581.1 DUF885 domain-containing protein [Alteromonas aestuariivivens]
MKITTIALTVGLTGILMACSQPQTSAAYSAQLSSVSESAGKQALKEKEQYHTQIFLKQQPTLATMLALSAEQAGGSYNDRLPDYRVAGMQAMQTAMAAAAAELRSIDTDELGAPQRYHQQILANIFEYFTGDTNFPAGYIDTWGGHLPYIINQISGPLIDVPKLMQVQQSVASPDEAQAYLTRLGKMDEFVQGVLGKYRADMQKGIILPKNLHPKTLAFFDAFLAAPAQEHELVRSFAEKLTQMDGLSSDEQQALTARAASLVEDVVYPAYQQARQLMVESAKIARDEDGIWSQPGGDEFYQHEIRFLGDSSLTADQIHQIGLDEVARISAEMDTILKANGLENGSVGERMMELATLPGQVFEESDAGRQALIQYLNQEISAIMARAPQFYGTLPEQAVEVRRIPPVSEAGEAGGFYSPPSLDGKRPGIYWINLRDMAAVPKYGLKTLTYHEAVPGHHFQIALNMAQDIGLMRQNAPYNAYVEGWALYSEYVASTMMGMYQDDPLGDLGRLQAELYRAVRLVVDTGLHRKKWTRQQAIDYFHATTGTSLSDVVPEVERYMAWPGQALGYKLGMLMFVELQKQAEQALGDKFDLREFHDLILLSGARPMAMVKQDVENWIKQQKL